MSTVHRPRTVFVAGSKGMVGRALVRNLSRDSSVETVERTRSELDLRDGQAVGRFFRENRIDEVYLAAARVGGIVANDTFPVEFLSENIAIQNAVIHAAHLNDVNKLLFLGSSCIYPKMAEQPIVEESFMGGKLEPTNRAYAIAKIAGIELINAYRRQHGRDYRAVMPTNLYGPHDNFHPEYSHVLPGLMQRFARAASRRLHEVEVWGSGSPRREFMYVDDMASACVHVMNISREMYDAAIAYVRPNNGLESQSNDTTHLNVGTGRDCTIAELAQMIAEVVNFSGEIKYDPSKPDGTPRKLLNVSALEATGWACNVALKDGLKMTWEWYLANSQGKRYFSVEI